MLILFLAVLLVAVLLAVASIHADLKARERTPTERTPPGPQEGVWPPPPTTGRDE